MPQVQIPTIADPVIKHAPKPEGNAIPELPILTTSGVLAGEQVVSTHEVQNLADEIGHLSEVAMDCGIEIVVRINIGRNRPPTVTEIAQFNALLRKVNQQMKLG